MEGQSLSEHSFMEGRLPNPCGGLITQQSFFFYGRSPSLHGGSMTHPLFCHKGSVTQPIFCGGLMAQLVFYHRGANGLANIFIIGLWRPMEHKGMHRSSIVKEGHAAQKRSKSTSGHFSRLLVFWIQGDPTETWGSMKAKKKKKKGSIKIEERAYKSWT
jgi:hypothetical protein